MIDTGLLYVGAVIRIDPGPRSWDLKNHYYVEVIAVDEKGFTTTMKGGHNRRFEYSSWEWEHYHRDRITLIGPVWMNRALLSTYKPQITANHIREAVRNLFRFARFDNLN